MKAFVRIAALFLIGVVVLGVVGCPAPPAAPTVIEWKLQSAFVDKDMSTEIQARGLAKEVEKATNGRLRITVFPEGALCPADQLFDNLKRGTFPIALSNGLYNSDFMGEIATLESMTPFTWTNLKDDQELFTKRGLTELLREVYTKYNMHFLGAWPAGSYNCFGNFPVRSLADYKGKKVRAWGPYGKIIASLGGSAATIPGGEIYMALKLGTIDGAFWTTAEVSTLKYYEVAKYFSKPGWIMPNASVYVNLAAWKSLPDDIRKTVQEVNDRLSFGEIFQKYAAADDDALKVAQQNGMQILTLPDAEVASLRAMALPIWDEYAKKDADCAKFVKILKDYYGMK